MRRAVDYVEDTLALLSKGAKSSAVFEPEEKYTETFEVKSVR
jgi:hypothetical protein